jgi:hypothetical protein
MLNKLSSEQREFLKKWYSDSSPSQLDDTEHIQGHELLEPPYNFTEDRILKDVREGKLVP